jgi:Na+/H+ antiporter NhaD/arsenite permease-like protein
MTPLFIAQAETHAVPMGTTVVFATLLVALVACLALEEKIHAKKSIITGGFAVICLLAAAALHVPMPFGPYNIGGVPIDIPVYIPAIDWGVITIILGSSLFVDATSRSGLFTWIAIRLTKASRGDPRRLLWYYGIMTVVFSAVLNNVTAMLIVGALTHVSLNKLGRRNMMLGFLIIEALLTNVGGLLTLISSVPNIIVGTTAGIGFVAFFLKASPYVLVATAITIAVGARVFQIRKLASAEEQAEALRLVSGFDETDGIESRGFFWFGAVMLVLFILAISTASVLPYVQDLGMGFVALTFAFIMLLRFKSSADEFYRALDWDLLGFFAALFAVINVMEHAGVLALIGKGVEPLLNLGPAASNASLIAASAVFSSVTDNIPLSAMLAKILAGIPVEGAMRGPNDPSWWAVIFGANLGGNITPIGSASTLVAVTLMHRYELRVTFVGFVKKAVPFAAIQLVLAMLYLFLLGLA